MFGVLRQDQTRKSVRAVLKEGGEEIFQNYNTVCNS